MRDADRACKSSLSVAGSVNTDLGQRFIRQVSVVPAVISDVRQSTCLTEPLNTLLPGPVSEIIGAILSNRQKNGDNIIAIT